MSLRSLSDRQILSRIQNLVRQERDTTLAVLVHLNEIERRKLHLKLGHSSLFDYCTAKLGYSASAAVRRIRTARCVARFAGVYDLLAKNEVNLSTIAQASRVLDDTNHQEILARIRGKSQREVDSILAEYQPAAMPRDRVRTVVVRGPSSRGDDLLVGAVASPGFAALDGVGRACEKSDYNRSGCNGVVAINESRVASTVSTSEPPLEKRIVLHFCVRPEFMAKLEKIKSLAWHRLPANAPLERVFELMMDHMIEKEDPARRIERREKRAARREQREERRETPATRGMRPEPGDEGRTGQARKQANSRATQRPRTTKPARSKPGARHIPAVTRDRVFQRDGGRCAFVGSDGRRCSTTRGLQIDHIVPVARGGPGEADNLRLLCARHNRLEAERLLGPWAGGRCAGGGKKRSGPTASPDG